MRNRQTAVEMLGKHEQIRPSIVVAAELVSTVRTRSSISSTYRISNTEYHRMSRRHSMPYSRPTYSSLAASCTRTTTSEDSFSIHESPSLLRSQTLAPEKYRSRWLATRPELLASRTMESVGDGPCSWSCLRYVQYCTPQSRRSGRPFALCRIAWQVDGLSLVQ